MSDNIELIPDPSRVIEGLRDTGYEFNTAMADIVDNSISAGATKIDVKINIDTNNKITVLIADNGCGMNFEELKNAMTYGSKKRSDPKSLGKFGLGLKTASTAFCRSLSLLSKSDTSEYNKVTWDLDYVATVNAWKLLHEDVNQDEVNYLESITQGGSGTLVIWNKVDRLIKLYRNKTTWTRAYERIVDSLIRHFEMTYQKFLDKKYTNRPISIIINDKEIKPWDPLCLEEERTEILYDNDVSIQMEGKEEISKFHLKAVLLPRVEDWSSPTAHSKARVNNDNQGFYVYRENRLIYFGDWLHTYTNDPHYSLLRIDFSFNHEFDDFFNVDIKKSQIKLNEDIFEFLKEQILPAPRKRASDLYRATESKRLAIRGEDKHKKSNKTLESKGGELTEFKIKIIDEKEGTVQIENKNGTTTGKFVIIDNSNYNHRVLPKAMENDLILWQGTLAKQEHAVTINTRHPFYYKIYSKIDNVDVVAGLDYLLWSLAEAELSTINERTKRQYEDMRVQVSQILKELLEEIPDNIEGDN